MKDDFTPVAVCLSDEITGMKSSSVPAIIIKTMYLLSLSVTF